MVAMLEVGDVCTNVAMLDVTCVVYSLQKTKSNTFLFSPIIKTSCSKIKSFGTKKKFLVNRVLYQLAYNIIQR